MPHDEICARCISFAEANFEIRLGVDKHVCMQGGALGITLYLTIINTYHNGRGRIEPARD